MTATKKFDLRTSYAGCNNSDADVKQAEKITGKYPSLQVRYVHDKGAALEMSTAEFARFEIEMRAANLEYLIDEPADEI